MHWVYGTPETKEQTREQSKVEIRTKNKREKMSSIEWLSYYETMLYILFLYLDRPDKRLVVRKTKIFDL